MQNTAHWFKGIATVALVSGAMLAAPAAASADHDDGPRNSPPPSIQPQRDEERGPGRGGGRDDPPDRERPSPPDTESPAPDPGTPVDPAPPEAETPPELVPPPESGVPSEPAPPPDPEPAPAPAVKPQPAAPKPAPAPASKPKPPAPRPAPAEQPAAPALQQQMPVQGAYLPPAPMVVLPQQLVTPEQLPAEDKDESDSDGKAVGPFSMPPYAWAPMYVPPEPAAESAEAATVGAIADSRSSSDEPAGVPVAVGAGAALLSLLAAALLLIRLQRSMR